VLRVGLAASHVAAAASAAASPAPRALARLGDVRAGGRTARLDGGDDEGGGWGAGRPPPAPATTAAAAAADFALPASSLADGGALCVSAWDWAWATSAAAPLSFTRPADARAGPATLALPLARLAAAPSGRTAGVFALGGDVPLGLRPAVALDIRWAPFMGGGGQGGGG
jgi:hypothetical protein